MSHLSEAAACRMNALLDVEAEREYQDRKWGGPANDDLQAEADWLAYIAEYAGGAGRAANYDFRTRMVKVAALAVAAVEAHDRKLSRTRREGQ
jgi:hypothetical protein